MRLALSPNSSAVLQQTNASSASSASSSASQTNASSAFFGLQQTNSKQPSDSSTSLGIASSSPTIVASAKDKPATDSFSSFRKPPPPQTWKEYLFVPAKQPLANVWESDIPHDVKLNFSCALQFKHIVWPFRFSQYSTAQSSSLLYFPDDTLVKLTDELRKEFLILVWNWARGCLSDQDYVAWLETNEPILVCKKQSSLSSASESMRYLHLDKSTDANLAYFLEPFGFL